MLNAKMFMLDPPAVISTFVFSLHHVIGRDRVFLSNLLVFYPNVRCCRSSSVYIHTSVQTWEEWKTLSTFPPPHLSGLFCLFQWTSERLFGLRDSPSSTRGNGKVSQLKNEARVNVWFVFLPVEDVWNSSGGGTERLLWHNTDMTRSDWLYWNKISIYADDTTVFCQINTTLGGAITSPICGKNTCFSFGYWFVLKGEHKTDDSFLPSSLPSFPPSSLLSLVWIIFHPVVNSSLSVSTVTTWVHFPANSFT